MSIQVLDVAVARADVLLLDVLGPLFDALHQNQPPRLRAWSAGGHGTRSLLHNAIDICSICNDVGRLEYPKSAVELADIIATDLFEAASDALSEDEYAQFVAACSTAPRKTSAKKPKKVGPTSTAMETAQLFFAPGKKRNNPARKKPARTPASGRYNGHGAEDRQMPADAVVEYLIIEVLVPAMNELGPSLKGLTNQIVTRCSQHDYGGLRTHMHLISQQLTQLPPHIKNLADFIGTTIDEDILG